jgi:hypothetical protein
MKKTALALTIISALIVSAVGGILSINFAKGQDAGDILASSPHAIVIESPSNCTIYKDAMPLNLTVTFLEQDGPIFWQGLTFLSYSIDGRASGDIVNETVLDSPFQWSHVLMVSELSNGQHKIEVTAVFVASIGNDFVPTYTLVSVPTYFTVDSLSAQPTESPTAFPTTLVITASGASLAVVCVALLVYFKKRKRQSLK